MGSRLTKWKIFKANLPKRIASHSKGTEALKLYQKTLRESKFFGNPEYEAYRNEYYKISKELRKAGVKLSLGHQQGDFIPGEVAHYDTRANIMGIDDFMRYSARYRDLSAQQIALKQYNLLPNDVAETLQQALRDNGLGEYSLDVIKARQLPDEVWLKM